MNQLGMQIALTLMDGVGDVLIKNLISYCGSAEEVFRQKKQHLLKIPGIGQKAVQGILHFKQHKKVEDELRFIEQHHITPYFYLDADYPSRMRHVHDAPVLLYTKGNLLLNPSKVVGIVGTRRATSYGRSFVQDLVHDLVGIKCTIVSGMAFGIDIQAHKQALLQGLPTIGVMAHGLDRIYPYQHTKTAEQMYSVGGLITEFPSETNPDKENFPKRNRIIAGLCDVLVVVETAERGGAMITADIADSYNRDVMALPGRVGDAYSIGCNQLIKKNKAAVITNATDLIEIMNWDIQTKKKKVIQPELFGLNAEDERLIKLLKMRGKCALDDLALSLNEDPGKLSLQLLDLEFRNIIRTLPGKIFELQYT